MKVYFLLNNVQKFLAQPRPKIDQRFFSSKASKRVMA
jgi:hypothetical protein